LAILADHAIWAIDQFAGIYTSASDTFFIIGASDLRAGITLTIAIDADHTAGTFEVAAKQATSTLVADHACRTRGSIIGHTVTVVVSAIADFWLWLRCIATNPLAILASFLTRATRALAWSGQAIID
jgi:hypothetical protein